MSDIRSINTSTQFCSVIGNPISHSLSPAIHNAGYAKLGLDFVYVANRVEDVKSCLAGMRALENFRGMSITIPHKIDAMQYVDTISDVDLAIGSINSVVNENGKLEGFNTDGPGAKKAIEDAGVDLNDKRILMVGAGGAARAIAFTLAWDPRIKDLTLLDIDHNMLASLGDDLKTKTQASIHTHPMNDDTLANAMQTADVIVHCTPIGMYPKTDASLIDPKLFRKGQVVFDVVYTPLETKLLKDAKACGLKIVSGVEMFIHQAVLQFERFTGEQAPVQTLRDVVMEHLKK
ncbi:MAG: shikimate dehydrogenase [Pseudomonadota bacterium]